MCDPVTLTTIGATVAAHAGAIATASTIGSTVLGVAGGIQTARGQQAADKYQGQVADINAKTADQQAQDAIARGEEDAQAHGVKVAQLRGSQTASMAAQGLELGYGTPLDVAQDTSVGAAADARRIRENAGREADSYRISAANRRVEAVGARASAQASRSSMLINAGSTILGGATQLAGINAKYGKPA
jgi:hypothetical protein